MGSLTKRYKTDKDLERKGVGIEFDKNDDGTVQRIDIARAGRANPEYLAVIDRIMKPHRRADTLGVLPAAKKDELTREAFAEAGIVGWSNIPASDITGDPKAVGYLPYSKANAVSLLTNLPELYTDLIELAVGRETFLEVEKEEDAKNSVTTSSTGLTTASTNVS